MGNPWSLSRLELRAPLVAGGDPFARVELIHGARGRITDIGRGDGPLDSIFKAIAQIVGFEAIVRSIDIDYRPPTPQAHTAVTAKVTLGIAERSYSGSAVSADLLTSCINAYLEAAASASAGEMTAPTSGGRP